MIKKYLPFILLIAAAFLLFWIKNNQRGATVNRPVNIEVTVPESTIKAGNEPFNRDISNINYSKHARCRMDCRQVDESEVKEILKHGIINFSKIGKDSRGKTYPLEGITHDKQHVRIVVAPHADELVIVTVIDLDKEWACDCG